MFLDIASKHFKTNISHYGDIAAIPFFALLFYYFYMIELRTPLENILMLFCLSGLILDLFFTVHFLRLIYQTSFFDKILNLYWSKNTNICIIYLCVICVPFGTKKTNKG